jgi:hypothetical protein
MPYQPHTLLVWGGSYNNANLAGESWACSLRLSGVYNGAAAWAANLNEATAKARAFHSNAAISQTCVMEWLKLNPIGPDGRYANPELAFTEDVDPWQVGGGVANMLPLQNSIAVTLYTSRRRGIASRGRFYTPGVPTTALASGSGLLDNTAQGALRTASITFLNALKTWSSGWTSVPVVASQGAAGGAGEGVSLPIVEVSVGRVIDTQRRRRNKLEEMHTPFPL